MVACNGKCLENILIDLTQLCQLDSLQEHYIVNLTDSERRLFVSLSKQHCSQS